MFEQGEYNLWWVTNAERKVKKSIHSWVWKKGDPPTSFSISNTSLIKLFIFPFKSSFLLKKKF